jgi:hypothetical protein
LFSVRANLLFSRDKTASRDYFELRDITREPFSFTGSVSQRPRGFVNPTTIFETCSRSYNTEMLKVFTPLDGDVLLSLWWSLWGSNPRPQHCQRCALPTELKPHYQTVFANNRVMSRTWQESLIEIQIFTRLKSSNLVKYFAICTSCLTSELWWS